jgi:hypothetical protein
MKRLLFIIGIALTLLFVASTAFKVQAADPRQGLVTPTPGPDGRILFTVQPGQTCTQIATLAGIPIAQLRLLNNLDENCILQVGQKVLIGMGGPSGAPATSSGPLPTATPGQPTPTPGVPGEANVCVLLFDDINGDALRQDTEVVIPDGAISVIGTSGQYSKTATTVSGADPICFDKVIQGTYNISVAAPEGYNATTQHNYTLDIKAGEQIYVDFGAQLAGQAKPQDPANDPGSNNLLGVVGGVLVLAGIGLGIYAWMIYGRRPSYELRK